MKLNKILESEDNPNITVDVQDVDFNGSEINKT